MNDSPSVFDLSPAEKLQLVQDLWDDLAASPGDVPVHNWQIQELERRKANLQKNPGSGLSSEIQRIEPIAKFEDRVESLNTAVPPTALEVAIDSDLAPYFPTAESVNDALRALVAIARRNGAA